MPTPIHSPADLSPGDYYEDCAFHPCVCMRVDSEDDEIQGISLVDGSFPRSCSGRHCGVRKLSFAEALHWRFFGPADQTIPSDKRWWHDGPKRKRRASFSSIIPEIERLPHFRTFQCQECSAEIRVHALQIYAVCPGCGMQIKCRASGAIGTELEDVIDAVLAWSGEGEAFAAVMRRRQEILADANDPDASAETGT